MKFESFRLFEDNVIIPIPESYRDSLYLVRSDTYRVSKKCDSIFKLLIKYLFVYRNQLLFWFRLSQYKGFLYPFTSRIYRNICKKRCIDIPPDTKVGFGLYLGHNMGIVVNSGTIIGNNVNLSHFVSIGTNSGTPAVIGNCVYVGPGVCVVENVQIGNSSTIGAGAVVVKDVPCNATVAGVPARVLNYSNPGIYIHNCFPLMK